MTKREKLLQRFLAVPEPSNFTWGETLSLMESLGFEWRQSSGSLGGLFTCRILKFLLRCADPIQHRN